MLEQENNIFPQNRFDENQNGDAFGNQSYTESPPNPPPGTGGGPTTPGTNAVMIDSYIFWLIGAAILIIFFFKNKLTIQK